MSSLGNRKPRPGTYVENGHNHALRDSAAFSFDGVFTGIAPAGIVFKRFLTGARAVVFEGGDISITQENVLVEIYEDVDFLTAGAPGFDHVINMNRINPRATEVLFFDNPTITDIGTRVVHADIKGAAGQNINQPGFGSGTQEFVTVLKPNTEHVLRIENKSIANVDVELDFYYREVNPSQYQ